MFQCLWILFPSSHLNRFNVALFIMITEENESLKVGLWKLLDWFSSFNFLFDLQILFIHRFSFFPALSSLPLQQLLPSSSQLCLIFIFPSNTFLLHKSTVLVAWLDQTWLEKLEKSIEGEVKEKKLFLIFNLNHKKNLSPCCLIEEIKEGKAYTISALLII